MLSRLLALRYGVRYSISDNSVGHSSSSSSQAKAQGHLGATRAQEDGKPLAIDQYKECWLISGHQFSPPRQRRLLMMTAI